MIGNRLKGIRTALNLTLTVFAKSLNIGKSSLSKIENELTVPSAQTFISLMKRYNINTNWLLTGEGEMFITEYPIAENGGCQLIRIEAEISAGLPVEVTGEPVDYLYIDKNIINNINNYYIFKVNGQSMEPGIMHQDTVIIRKCNNWNENRHLICAVRVDGEITLKRIIHADKQKLLVLISDNSDYEPIVVDPKHSKVALIGFLFYLIRKVQ